MVGAFVPVFLKDRSKHAAGAEVAAGSEQLAAGDQALGHIGVVAAVGIADAGIGMVGVVEVVADVAQLRCIERIEVVAGIVVAAAFGDVVAAGVGAATLSVQGRSRREDHRDRALVCRGQGAGQTPQVVLFCRLLPV